MPSNNVKLIEVIFNTPVLKAQLDVHLDSGGKINAIKALVSIISKSFKYLEKTCVPP